MKTDAVGSRSFDWRDDRWRRRRATEKLMVQGEKSVARGRRGRRKMKDSKEGCEKKRSALREVFESGVCVGVVVQTAMATWSLKPWTCLWRVV